MLKTSQNKQTTEESRRKTLKYRNHTRKINMEPENTPLEKAKSSSKPSFSGSMLIFRGVVEYRNENPPKIEDET